MGMRQNCSPRLMIQLKGGGGGGCESAPNLDLTGNKSSSYHITILARKDELRGTDKGREEPEEGGAIMLGPRSRRSPTSPGPQCQF